MIRIGITLDDVIRAKTAQIGKIYKKYINPELKTDELDLSTNNYQKIFGFETKSEYNKFLYEDYPFEIFGEAGVTSPSLDKKLNLWHLALNNHEEIDDELELVLINPMEYNASIGCTHFFLSKIATRVRETYFPSNMQNIWDRCDILITAEPRLISKVPDNKICVKITTDYNRDVEHDETLTFDNLIDFISDNYNLLTVVKKYNKTNG
jgi:hypothetical protein